MEHPFCVVVSRVSPGSSAVSLFPAAGLAAPDQQPPPQSIGSSLEYDTLWKQLQDQQFAGGDAPDANLNARRRSCSAQSVSMPNWKLSSLPLVEALGDLAHVVGVQLLVRPERAEIEQVGELQGELFVELHGLGFAGRL